MARFNSPLSSFYRTLRTQSHIGGYIGDGDIRSGHHCTAWIGYRSADRSRNRLSDSHRRTEEEQNGTTKPRQDLISFHKTSLNKCFRKFSILDLSLELPNRSTTIRCDLLRNRAGRASPRG